MNGIGTQVGAYEFSASLTQAEGDCLLQLPQEAGDFLKKIGLAVSLSELGVDLNNARRLIDDTLLYMAGGVKNNPVAAGKEEIFQLLKASL